MGTPRARAFGLLLSWGALLAACGGGGGPPAPLARHFDEMQFLGGIPVDQRQPELDAKSAYDKALMEQSKANADYAKAKEWLDVANNERKAAKLDEDSAKTRQKAAKESADQTRIKEAETEMNGVRLAADAADKRYAYLLAYSKWMKLVIRYTENQTYWREAQYELAQAKIAAKNNIQPAGFNLDNFVRQEADRNKKTQDAKRRAESEKSSAMSSRTSWLALQKQSDKLLGKQSEFPDPLDPASVQGVGYTPGGEGSDADKHVQDTQDPTMKDPAPDSGSGPKGGGGDDADDQDDDGDDDMADPDEGGE